jgi:hypothetical protein
MSEELMDCLGELKKHVFIYERNANYGSTELLDGPYDSDFEPKCVQYIVDDLIDQRQFVFWGSRPDKDLTNVVRGAGMAGHTRLLGFRWSHRNLKYKKCVEIWIDILDLGGFQ